MQYKHRDDESDVINEKNPHEIIHIFLINVKSMAWAVLRARLRYHEIAVIV